MAIRLEFAHNRSISLPWVLRMCKAYPSFKETFEDGLRVYSVDFGDSDADLTAIEAIGGRIRAWKQIAFYVNGKLVATSDVMGYIMSRKYRRNRLLWRGNAKDFIDSL